MLIGKAGIVLPALLQPAKGEVTAPLLETVGASRSTYRPSSRSAKAQIHRVRGR